MKEIDAAKIIADLNKIADKAEKRDPEFRVKLQKQRDHLFSQDGSIFRNSVTV